MRWRIKALVKPHFFMLDLFPTSQNGRQSFSEKIARKISGRIHKGKSWSHFTESKGEGQSKPFMKNPFLSKNPAYLIETNASV